MLRHRAQRALEERTGLAFDAAALARLDAGLERLDAAGRSPATLVAALEAGDAAAERELVEAVTLQETRFFRDPAVFEALARDVLPSLPDPVTVWSAGCALGQEAYSLAMLLDEAGRPGFRVLATDLSPAAVAHTAAGVYGERELRGLDAGRRVRHLQATDDGRFTIGEHLREHVSTGVHNLVRGPLPGLASACHLVLCRYVLIYAQRPAVTALLQRLHDRLPAGTLLVVGAAESLWHLSDRFTLEPLADGFAYRRAGDAPAGEPAAGGGTDKRGGGGRGRRNADAGGRERAHGRGATRTVSGRAADPAVARWPAAPVDPGQAGRRSSRAAALSAAADPAPVVGRVAPAELLAAGAREHAAGAFAEAATLFRQAAYLDPSSPTAHLQLGLALEAAGDPGAERAFRAAHRALGAADPEVIEQELGGHAVADLARLLADRLGNPGT
ncbi:hypothetical protein DSM112329_03773 [Paraconexibacter sp. AEG42_29]|uniref:CheR-type methyltransferase domain-containing protein n=1 Tax=Paraconexibacter sp. AEG42_29 TaxID=2997339 RepID=A0AAU7AYU6_9ACTN